MRIYIQEMVRMLALPQGAELTMPVSADAAGRKGERCSRHADGTDARTAAAVGDAEGFMEVEVADIGSDVAGTGEADLGVHVGAVHVNLAAVGVDDLADIDDGFLEDAVGGSDR